MAYEGPHPFPITSGGTSLTSSQPVVQVVTASITTAQSTQLVDIPFDNTAPRWDEGAEITINAGSGLQITPQAVGNILFVSFNFNAFIEGSFNSGMFTLFLNPTLATDEAVLTRNTRNLGGVGNNFYMPIMGIYRHVTTTIAEHTFKMRFGMQSGGTAGIDFAIGGNPSALFGTSNVQYVMVTEYLP